MSPVTTSEAEFERAVEVNKAILEQVHRLMAGALGLMVLLLAALAVRRKPQGLPTLAVGVALVVAAIFTYMHADPVFALALAGIGVAPAADVGRPLLETMFHRRSVRRYLGWLDHPHFTAYFAAAIALPVAPDDLLCYLAGLTKMRVRTYVLIILLLKPWSILAYSFGVIAVLQRWLPWLGV